MNLTTDICFFVISFIVIFLLDYFLFLNLKKKRVFQDDERIKKKKKNILEVSYLSAKFKISKNKLYKTSILLWIAVINAFIISSVSTIIFMIPVWFFLKLLIGILLLFLLIYSLYEIFGKILVRKGYK